MWVANSEGEEGGFMPLISINYIYHIYIYMMKDPYGC